MGNTLTFRIFRTFRFQPRRGKAGESSPKRLLACIHLSTRLANCPEALSEDVPQVFDQISVLLSVGQAVVATTGAVGEANENFGCFYVVNIGRRFCQYRASGPRVHTGSIVTTRSSSYSQARRATPMPSRSPPVLVHQAKHSS